MADRVLHILLKYCGGCNPEIDRGAIVKRLEGLIGREGLGVQFTPTVEKADLLLLINGCPHACIEKKYIDSVKSVPFVSVQGAGLDRRPVLEEELPQFVWEKIKEGMLMDAHDQDYQQMIEKAAQLGYQYEIDYFGCSQSTLAALMEAFGMGGRDILRASTAFAGGVARRGNVCGALSGGLIMIGFLTGRDDLEMLEQYQRGMGFADKLCKRFEEEYGTLICKEIQKIKLGRTFDLQKEQEREALHTIMASNPEACQAVTRDASRWTAEIVVEILKQGTPLARMLAQGNK